MTGSARNPGPNSNTNSTFEKTGSGYDLPVKTAPETYPKNPDLEKTKTPDLDPGSATLVASVMVEKQQATILLPFKHEYTIHTASDTSLTSPLRYTGDER